MSDRQDNPGPRELAQRNELGSARNGTPTTSFDRWLSRRLHEAYDNVLREPLPGELEQLVLQLAASQRPAAHLDRHDHDGQRARERRLDLMASPDCGRESRSWDG